MTTKSRLFSAPRLAGLFLLSLLLSENGAEALQMRQRKRLLRRSAIACDGPVTSLFKELATMDGITYGELKAIVSENTWQADHEQAMSCVFSTYKSEDPITAEQKTMLEYVFSRIDTEEPSKPVSFTVDEPLPVSTRSSVASVPPGPKMTALSNVGDVTPPAPAPPVPPPPSKPHQGKDGLSQLDTMLGMSDFDSVADEPAEETEPKKPPVSEMGDNPIVSSGTVADLLGSTPDLGPTPGDISKVNGRFSQPGGGNTPQHPPKRYGSMGDSPKDLSPLDIPLPKKSDPVIDEPVVEPPPPPPKTPSTHLSAVDSVIASTPDTVIDESVVEPPPPPPKTPSTHLSAVDSVTPSAPGSVKPSVVDEPIVDPQVPPPPMPPPKTPSLPPSVHSSAADEIPTPTSSGEQEDPLAALDDVPSPPRGKFHSAPTDSVNTFQSTQPKARPFSMGAEPINTKPFSMPSKPQLTDAEIPMPPSDSKAPTKPGSVPAEEEMEVEPVPVIPAPPPPMEPSPVVPTSPKYTTDQTATQQKIKKLWQGVFQTGYQVAETAAKWKCNAGLLTSDEKWTSSGSYVKAFETRASQKPATWWSEACSTVASVEGYAEAVGEVAAAFGSVEAEVETLKGEFGQAAKSLLKKSEPISDTEVTALIEPANGIEEIVQTKLSAMLEDGGLMASLRSFEGKSGQSLPVTRLSRAATRNMMRVAISRDLKPALEDLQTDMATFA